MLGRHVRHALIGFPIIPGSAIGRPNRVTIDNRFGRAGIIILPVVTVDEAQNPTVPHNSANSSRGQSSSGRAAEEASEKVG
jgi:hypothetical protein